MTVIQIIRLSIWVMLKCLWSWYFFLTVWNSKFRWSDFQTTLNESFTVDSGTLMYTVCSDVKIWTHYNISSNSKITKARKNIIVLYNSNGFHTSPSMVVKYVDRSFRFRTWTTGLAVLPFSPLPRTNCMPLPQLHQDRFLRRIFWFINHQSSYHLKLYKLSYSTVLK